MHDYKRVEYLDALRAIAIVMVVVVHITAYPVTQWLVVGTYEWWVNFVFYVIARACVPLFFMISGALFLNSGKQLAISTMWRKYIPRIVIAFILFSFLYAIVNVWIEYTNPQNMKVLISKIIRKTIVGNYHLWFLYAILGLYIITPFLKKIVENRCIMFYFLIVSFMTTSVIPTLLHFFPNNSISNSVLSDVALYMPQWSFYFVFGHALNTIDFTSCFKAKNNNMILGLAACGGGDSQYIM